MSLTIYGIKNCDTMKKARAWLDKAGQRLCLPRLQGRRHRPRPAGGLGGEGRLGGAAEPCRHDLPQAARGRQGGADREEGDRADAGAAVDDQAAGAGGAAAASCSSASSRTIMRSKLVIISHTMY